MKDKRLENVYLKLLEKEGSPKPLFWHLISKSKDCIKFFSIYKDSDKNEIILGIDTLRKDHFFINKWELDDFADLGISITELSELTKLNFAALKVLYTENK